MDAQAERVLRTSIPEYDPVQGDHGFLYDHDRAREAVAFFEKYLWHFKGRPSRFLLEDWQKAIVWSLFGFVDDAGRRRYRESGIWVPRKNGKTHLGAGIAGKLLFADGEHGAEVYAAAADTFQAGILFGILREQVLMSTALSKVSKALQNRIVYPRMRSFLRVLSSDASTKHGFDSHGVFLDELHAMGPKGEALVYVLQTSTGARKQPLVVAITTADYNRTSVCNEKYAYANGVRSGAIKDHRFLPVIYEASKKDDFMDPAVWRRCNPNLDVSITTEYLAREAERARARPSYTNTFLRLHLNVRTDVEDRWLPHDEWGRCGDDPELEGPCYAGLDLAAANDLAALVLYWPETHSVKCWSWAPRKTVERWVEEGLGFVSEWMRTGWLRTHAGKTLDFQAIEDEVRRVLRKYRVRQCGVDPHAATGMMQSLIRRRVKVAKFPQSAAMYTAPCRRLEALVLEGALRHGGDPVLAWCTENATLEVTDGGARLRPSRRLSEGKIDTLVALLMAIGTSLTTERRRKSYYSQAAPFTLGRDADDRRVDSQADPPEPDRAE